MPKVVKISGQRKPLIKTKYIIKRKKVNDARVKTFHCQECFLDEKFDKVRWNIYRCRNCGSKINLTEERFVEPYYEDVIECCR